MVGVGGGKGNEDGYTVRVSRYGRYGVRDRRWRKMEKCVYNA